MSTAYSIVDYVLIKRGYLRINEREKCPFKIGPMFTLCCKKQNKSLLGWVHDFEMKITQLVKYSENMALLNIID